MPKMQDYVCRCGERFEYMSMRDSDAPSCPACGETGATAQPGGRPFGTIVPMYRGSLKQKAGFVHTHGDRPAEKNSVAVPRTGDIT